ncbi:hypothetical protein C8Q78DRAFT_764499 [Trametes maxima]|nr:hypothetical protein C8Q78DRAFT_764499 [Trametes maxima]
MFGRDPLLLLLCFHRLLRTSHCPSWWSPTHQTCHYRHFDTALGTSPSLYRLHRTGSHESVIRTLYHASRSTLSYYFTALLLSAPAFPGVHEPLAVENKAVMALLFPLG